MGRQWHVVRLLKYPSRQVDRVLKHIQTPVIHTSDLSIPLDRMITFCNGKSASSDDPVVTTQVTSGETTRYPVNLL